MSLISSLGTYLICLYQRRIGSSALTIVRLKLGKDVSKRIFTSWKPSMYSFKSLHARNILRKVSLSDGKDKLPVVCNKLMILAVLIQSTPQIKWRCVRIIRDNFKSRQNIEYFHQAIERQNVCTCRSSGNMQIKTSIGGRPFRFELNFIIRSSRGSFSSQFP